MTLKGFELNKECTFKTLYKGVSFINKWTFNNSTFVAEDFEIPQEVCTALNS
ncbi:hypothetical protein [Polaribacter sp. IC073]|uniref:hypothetical protein n=1 Tax=Polaribacter sp. IC073 TaxID=2508540 RepID=UPI0016782DE2|nr:hypothetical protein [Polaribacter sp. IC073]